MKYIESYLPRITAFFINLGLLIQHVQADDIPVGEECYADSVCITFCCSNDDDYSRVGICIEMDDDARC